MQDHVTYEFYRCDNPVDPRDDSFEPLNGIPAADLDHAHAMLASRLKRSPTDSATPCYAAATGAFVLASESMTRSICAVFALRGFSMEPAIAIAEVCAFLRCKLVPIDGGPEVAPSAEALLADLVRRAIAQVRPAGTVLFPTSGRAIGHGPAA